MIRSPVRSTAALVWLLSLAAVPARAADPHPGPPLTIQRARGPIVLDGDLSDAGWQGIAQITKWFETRVGDSVEPQVANEAWLAYDDRYFYAAFRFEDPDPASIRAPLGDHDALSSATDYAGVLVDSRNDGKSAQMFLSNPRGLQYDALTNDTSGEDNSPDYFWTSAGRITDTGWNLEIRIPFSSLRYGREPDPTWGILLYRNYPRDRRYQFFSARLPRDANCFICNESDLTGLAELPHGSHLVAAPFTTTQQTRVPVGDLGTPLQSASFDSDAGLDLKWSPLAGVAVDATLNPDFSQVESDAAQIVANERFALFFAEKRPFFLEGVDLFSTPLQAVYTRTVTSPSGGLRATGRVGATSFTALATHDRGGGLVVLPGSEGSSVADQDFRSDVGIVRVRRDLGRSFVSALATTREVDGGGYNRVFGPDFEWRPRSSDYLKGQALWSETRTPVRPDLAGTWDGRGLSDRALLLAWSHTREPYDWYVQGQDIGPDFRADDGFIPQVGYREGYFETGYTTRPKNFMSRVRVFTIDYVHADVDGNVLARRVSLGAGMDGQLNSFVRVELNRDEIRVGDALLQRFRPRVYLQVSPGRMFNYLTLDAYVGDEIDVTNAREGSGATLIGSALVNPGDHLELRADASRRWLNVSTADRSGRLFAAEVERLRATWSFNSRSFLRLIGQYVQTKRDPLLYLASVDAKSASFAASGLFAYKLNWQTVLYVGYGDDRSFSEVTDRLEPSGRQAFAKLSYAWQN